MHMMEQSDLRYEVFFSQFLRIYIYVEVFFGISIENFVTCRLRLFLILLLDGKQDLTILVANASSAPLMLLDIPAEGPLDSSEYE